MSSKDEVNIAKGMVEVAFSGKKVFLNSEHLDKWREMSFEQRDAWVENHPFNVSKEETVYHPTFEGAAPGTDTDDDIDADIKKFQKPKKQEDTPGDFVVVHFNGKSLLLPRKEVNDWYENKSPEDKLEFLKNNPDVEIKI